MVRRVTKSILCRASKDFAVMQETHFESTRKYFYLKKEVYDMLKFSVRNFLHGQQKHVILRVPIQINSLQPKENRNYFVQKSSVTSGFLTQG